MAIVDRVRELVSPVVEAEGVELYDVEHNGGVLRVYVDADDGVDIDVIKRISRGVSILLDEADPIPGRYTLEVSSPGLERTLRTPNHFRDAVGAEVKVKTFPDVDGERRITGELVAADDQGFDLKTDGGLRRVTYDHVSKARTVFVWGPSPKPGKGPGRAQKEAPTS